MSLGGKATPQHTFSSNCAIFLITLKTIEACRMACLFYACGTELDAKAREI
jgi:hypothetical protein